MAEAKYTGINWTDAAEATGAACLNNFDPNFYANQKVKPKWLADTNEVLFQGMIRALLDAHRMVWMCQLRYDLRTGHITPEGAPTFAELVSGVPNPVGSQDTRTVLRQFAEGDATIAAVPDLYDVLSFEVVQAMRSSRPIKPPQPQSDLLGLRAELSFPPVALVLLGIAAIAGVTYFGTEVSVEMAKSWSAIEIEKAWAVQRAWAEIEIAKQKIAAGQTVEISDWSKVRATVARAEMSKWGPTIAVAALALALGGAAYVFRPKHAARSSSATTENPARRRRRRSRRRNPSSSLSKPRRAAPKRKRNAAPKRKRNAAPKRTRTRSMRHAIDTWSEDEAAVEVRSTGDALDAAVDDGRGTKRLERRYLEALEIERSVRMAGARKRNAAPKRKRNAAPKRKRNPVKVSHGPHPSGKFIRSQHAKGRSTAQARSAWKLSHKKRHGKRAGKR